MKKNKVLGNIILFATAIIWGSSFVFQHESAAVTPPYTYSAARITLAAAALWILTLIMEKSDIGGYSPAKHPEMQTKDFWIGGIVCGVFLTGGTTLQQLGIGLTTAGKSAFVTALYTVLVPLFGWLVYKQKLTGRRIFGACLAMCGLYILCVREDLTIGKGELITFVAAICFAFQMLSVEKYIQTNNPIKLSAVQFTVCAVLDWLLAIIFETPSWELIEPSLVSIIYVGLISGALGYTTQIIGQGMTDASIGAAICSLESVFAALAGWIFLHEVMSPKELLGAAMMFAAVIIVQLPSFGKAEGD